MRKLLLTFCMMCVIAGAAAQIDYLNEEERSLYLQHREAFDARFEIARQDRLLELARYQVRPELVSELKTIVETREAR